MRYNQFAILGLAVLVAACQTESATEPYEIISEAPLSAKPAPHPTSLWKLPLDATGLGLISDGRQDSGGFSVYEDGICGVTGKIFTDGSGDATLQTNNPRAKTTTCQSARRMSVVYPVGDPAYSGGGVESMLVFINLRNISNATTSIGLGYANRVARVLSLNPTQTERCDAWRWSDDGYAGDKVWVERIDQRTFHVYTKDRDPDPDVAAANAGKNRAVCTTTNQAHNLSVDLYVVAKQDVP